MPRYSKRIHFLRSLEHLLPLAMLLEDDPSPNSPYELYRLLHNATTRSRYLERGHRYTMNRDKGWRARIDTHHRKTDRDFRRLLRVDKAEFQYILSLIESHDVSVTARGRPQASPLYQLTVALFTLAHEGNGASAFMVAELFGLGGVSSTLNPLLSLSRGSLYKVDSEGDHSLTGHRERPCLLARCS